MVASNEQRGHPASCMTGDALALQTFTLELDAFGLIYFVESETTNNVFQTCFPGVCRNSNPYLCNNHAFLMAPFGNGSC